MKNYEDKIYSLGETVTGQTQAMSQAVQKTLENNGGVGIRTGSYAQKGTKTDRYRFSVYR